MSKCEECIHYDVCEMFGNTRCREEHSCRIFKDKSLFVELLCFVGQIVFFCCEGCDEQGKERIYINEGEIISFSLQKEGLWAYCRYKCGMTYWHFVESDFGKTVFFTKEEAEEKLKESEGEGR